MPVKQASRGIAKNTQPARKQAARKHPGPQPAPPQPQPVPQPAPQPEPAPQPAPAPPQPAPPPQFLAARQFLDTGARQFLNTGTNLLRTVDRNAGQYQLHVTLRPVQPAPEQASDEQAEPEQKRAQTACSMSLRTMLYALIALAVLVGAWRILSGMRW